MIGDVNGGGSSEAITSLSTGTVNAINGDGTTATGYDPQPASGETVDKSQVLGDRLTVLSIAPIIASALNAVFEDESVSEIFHGENQP